MGDEAATADEIETPAGFEGEVLTRASPGYHRARRIENERLMRDPVAIARCASVSDVQAALRLAREHGLRVAVRGGGHGAAGWSSIDGGIVIDLTALRWVRVDASERTAWVGGGALAVDIVSAAFEHGLAAVTGISGGVGLSGLLLGLGEGYLTARHGFGVDNVEAVELITASGDALRVSTDSHPDLFWAVRGAGPNFGVVTAMKLRLHPAPEAALGGTVTFGPGDTRRAIDHVWDLMENAAVDSWPSAAFFLGDDGLPRVNVTLGHVGSREDGEAALARLRAVGTPLSDTTRRLSYPDLVLRGGAVGDHTLRSRAVWNIYRFALDGDAEAQKQLVLDQQLRTRPSPATYISVWRTPTTPANAPESAAPRSAGISVFIRSMWDDPAEDEFHLRWMSETTQSFVDSGLVSPAANTINHVSQLQDSRLRKLYGDTAYRRLAALKAIYDPENVFSSNANIPPAPTSTA